MATIEEILSSKGESAPTRDERGRFGPSGPPPDTAGSSEGTTTTSTEPVQAAETPPAPPASPDSGEAPTAPETGTQQPESGKPPMVRGLEAGIAAERTKRQEAERERDEFRATVSQMQQQMLQMQQMVRGAPQQPQGPVEGAQSPQGQQPDVEFWENPVGFLQRQLTQMQQSQEGTVKTALFQQAEFAVKDRHEDYDEAREAFASLVAVNPQLRAEFQSKPPHEAVQFAYQTGRQALDAQREYWSKKLGVNGSMPPATPPPSAPAPVQTPPRSLNTESSAPVPVPSYQGPPPLQKTFRNKF